MLRCDLFHGELKRLVLYRYIEKRFYADFSPGEKEKAYKFAIGSSLK